MKQLVPRKFDRNRFLVDVEVKSLNGVSPFKAHALDLGQSGLAIFARRYLPVGHQIELVFRPSRQVDFTDGFKILGRVVNARVDADGNVMGILFAQALSGREVQSLETALGVNSRR